MLIIWFESEKGQDVHWSNKGWRIGSKENSPAKMSADLAKFSPLSSSLPHNVTTSYQRSEVDVE